MKRRPSIKSLACGLGVALLLLACLPTTALAAEKPISFSAMFPGYADGARDPMAAEEVLASMGTAVGQSQTANGVTLTLDGVIWNDGKMLLSFDIQGASIPKDIPSDIYFYREAFQVTLAEDQREAYVRSSLEESARILAGASARYTPPSQEETDTKIQEALSRGEPTLFHLPRLVHSEGKGRLLLSVSIPPYVEQPELTVHIENLMLFKNAEGSYWSRPYDGYEPLTLVSGPFDFTFTAEKHLKPLVYTGAVDVTVDGIPVQVQKITVTAFDAELEYETLQKLDLQNDSLNAIQKLESIRVNGVWTQDGLPLDGVLDDTLGGSVSTPNPELGKAWVTTGNTHPYAIDPASVTAVDLGGVRVDLGKLTLQENPPLQDIQSAPIYSGPEAEETEELTPAQIAQANAEREKKLEEAKKIAYQDLKTASKEMQAQILEARKLIINSTSWVADGYNAYTIGEDGKKTPLPHFSELFPGWEMP